MSELLEWEDSLKHLSPPVWQLRVSPDASLLVVMGLSVPTEVDGVGVDVDVHEVVHDFTLDVILHSVHQETAADVDDLDEGQVPVRRGEKRETLLKCDLKVEQDTAHPNCRL